MPDESELRQEARAAIRSGRLPSRKVDRLFGVTGANRTCALCGERIPRDQNEFELEFFRPGETPSVDRFNMHVQCFAAWEFVRSKPDDAQGRLSI